MSVLTSPEQAQAIESAVAALRHKDGDGLTWTPVATVHKFTAAQEAEAVLIAEATGRTVGQVLLEEFSPYDRVVSVGNLLTRQGRKRLMDRLAGTSSNQALDASHCRIGVGNGSTSAADTDTDLSASAGSGNRQFKLVDSAPTVGSGASSGVLTFVATFSTSVANFAWAEWGIDGGTGDGTTVTSEGNTTPGLVNRKVSSLGTKTSAQSWVFTCTITIT